MRPSVLPFLILLVSLSLLRAADPTAAELADQLQQKIQKLTKEKAKENEGTRYPLQNLNGQMTQAIKVAKLRGDTSSLQQMVDHLQSIVDDEEVSRLSDALIAKIAEESVASEQAYISKIDAAIEQGVKTALAAKEPKELDESILTLSKLTVRENPSSGFDLSRRTTEKARSAITFFCRWQDYLMQIGSGNYDAASGVLRSLSQETQAYPFVPRSEILARIQPASSTGKSEMRMEPELPSLKGKTLADLPTLRSTVRELVYRNPNSQAVRQFSDQLNGLSRANEQFNAGLLGAAFAYCTGRNGGEFGNDFAGDFLPLRQQLLIQLLPAYLDLGSSYPIEKNETAGDYLQRLIQETSAKKDWISLARALEAYRLIAFSEPAPAWLTADTQGINNFITAQNLEKAAQYVDAIRTYRRVVGSSGKYVPIDEAAARILALQKEQPDAFEKAEKPPEAIVRYPPQPTIPR